MAGSVVSPEVLLKAAGQFNRHEFWESHETLEAVWLTALEPEKTFLQGLIQAAAGCLHVENANYTGAVRVLGRALEKLHAVAGNETFKAMMNFVDFVAALEAVFAEVKRLGPDNLHKFCPGKFPEFVVKGA